MCSAHAGIAPNATVVAKLTGYDLLRMPAVSQTGVWPGIKTVFDRLTKPFNQEIDVASLVVIDEVHEALGRYERKPALGHNTLL